MQQIDCLAQFLKLHPLQKRNVYVKVTDKVLPPITHNWFAHYLWDIYKGVGHNGKKIEHTLPSNSLSHQAPN